MGSVFKIFISISVSLSLGTTALCQFPIKGYNIDNPTFLNSTISNYDVFLTAEMHFREEGSLRKRKMIEYLADKNSIDVIVVERSYDFGYWVSYYLETGDSLFLKEFLEIDDFFSTRNGVILDNEYKFYCWLRQYNLDNDLSIRVIGIDIGGLWDEKPRLWSFLKFIEHKPELKNQLSKSAEKAERFLQKKNLSAFRMVQWVRELENTTRNLDIKDTDFKNYIFNLGQSIPWTWKMDLNYRDGEIASNFKKYIDHGLKVYGQFGMTHVALESGGRVKWKTFGSLLNQDEYYKGKILSIGLVCIGCDPDTPEDSGGEPGPDAFRHFLTQDDFNRLKPELLKLPTGTLIDLRNTEEKIKDYCQLLLVEFD